MSKTVQTCMIIFLVIGIGVYQVLAPTLFEQPVDGGFNIARLVGAGIVGGIFAAVGTWVGKRIDNLRKKGSPSPMSSITGFMYKTQFTTAAMDGDVALLQYCLAKGVDVNTSQYGSTALMLATQYGRANAVTALLAAGANLHAKDKLGATALILAASKGHADIVKALLDAGADINSDTTTGYTSLMYAVHYAHPDTVKVLLEAGANVNTIAKNGTTVYRMAMNRGDTSIAQALLAKGADKNLGS